ncbi:MAG: hypothetical protein INQ03_06155 [Candidatus Heimdallarchaeota archaeon]|nr:hypothetical protein [Candidatus Heimdallarchaeota archaeon]
MSYQISIKNIQTRLKRLALQDGMISDEETTLMDNVCHNIKEYSDLVKNHHETGKVSSDELFEKKMSIIEEVYSIARNDTKISEDEKTLLKEICSIIMNL